MATTHRPLAVFALIAAASAAATAPPAGAAEPYLVRDINPEAGPPLGSDPRLTLVGDEHLFFFARDEVHGEEPWTTDGTAAGTRLLRDVCPGECPSSSEWQWALGERLLFSARSGPADERRLWASNGTWAGTVPLDTGVIRGFPLVGGLEDRGLYFFAAHQGETEGLWVTDGTPAGTRRLGVASPNGWPLSPYGDSSRTEGTLLFGAYRTATGYEPWASNGTEAGTRLVADLFPGPGSSTPFAFRQLPAGTTFFAAADFCTLSLWVSDGTPARTRRLGDFSDAECRTPVMTTVLRAGGAVYFVPTQGTAPRQLWRSDGTPAGTRALTSFTDEAFDGRSSYPDRMEASDQGVLFAADDGVHGSEPWFADAGGARLVADLCPGPCSSSPEAPAWLAGHFYFSADDGGSGEELWRSDGTAAGTRLVHDACPGNCGSHPVPVGSAAGRVFFFTDHPAQTGEDRALWATAPDGQGAERLSDLAPPDFGPATGFSALYAALGDRLLFTNVDAEHGREPWRSDGTPEGTSRVADVLPGRADGAGSAPALVTRWGDRVFFVADDGAGGFQPWVSDGTEQGTRRLGVVVEQEGGPAFSPPYADPVVLGPDVLFLARQATSAVELWRAPPAGSPARLLEAPAGPDGQVQVARLVRLGSRAVVLVSGGSDAPGGAWITDGTAAGTGQIAELSVFDRFSLRGGSVGELAGRLFFAASEEVSFPDLELWATDGTAAGTGLVKDLDPDRDSRPSDFLAFGGQLLFTASVLDSGRELWRTDGTAAGTRMVADLVPGFRGSEPRALTVVGARVFFIADDELAFPRLWTTDGTAAGTVPVSEVPRLAFSPDLPKHAAGGGRFFFIVDGADFTPELWVSDGTEAGTTSVQRLFGPSSRALGVWSAGDRVRVSVEDRPSSFDLWETDGTFAGTRRLASLPHTGFDQPLAEPAEANGLLFFSGPHPGAGQELMALPLGPPEPCAADAETLCLNGGRFAVRARWRDPRSGDQGTGGAAPLPGSDRSGLFWFFNPDNIELVVKVLDAGAVNGYVWNFYGALSDVEYWLEVEDTATGRKVEYHNPEGEICGRGDTRAFPARAVAGPPAAPAAAGRSPAAAPPAAGTSCAGDPGDLCLLGGRFRVEVEWADQRSGDTGVGTAVPGTDRSGFFWFFEPQNIELVVKILDARQVNGRFWVFYGALSDVAYTITVTDTETGEQATYHNPPGEICGRGDTAAF